MQPTWPQIDVCLLATRVETGFLPPPVPIFKIFY